MLPAEEMCVGFALALSLGLASPLPATSSLPPVCGLVSGTRLTPETGVSDVHWSSQPPGGAVFGELVIHSPQDNQCGSHCAGSQQTQVYHLILWTDRGGVLRALMLDPGFFCLQEWRSTPPPTHR